MPLKKILPLFQQSKRILSIIDNNKQFFEINSEISAGIHEKKPIVALESTIITHGMPYPENIQCAIDVENIIRDNGAIPATIAILNGKIKVGLSIEDLEYLGNTELSKPIKTSRRDFSHIITKKLNGGTTVAGTILVCQKIGLKIFATGGLGGVHRNFLQTNDVSADLIELSRANVAVISSGIKSILDISKTLEYLETFGVYVATLGVSKEFPAFYSRTSNYFAPYCVKNTKEAAAIIRSHLNLQMESGLLFAVPVPETYAFNSEIITQIISEALIKAEDNKIEGKAVTPFLLKEIATLTGGKSLITNIELIKNNAKIASEIAVHLMKHDEENIDENNSEYSSSSSSSSSTIQNHRPVIIGGSNLDCVARLQENEEIRHDGRIHFANFDHNAGGVGRNLCEAMGKLGFSTNFLTAIGDDHPGEILLKTIPKIAQKHILRIPECKTAECIVVLDHKGDCMFLIGNMNIHNKITSEMIELNENIIKKAPLIIMDGNVPLRTMDTILEMAKIYKIPVFFEPTDVSVAKKPFKTTNWDAIKLITPNKWELMEISEFFNIKCDSNAPNELLQISAILEHLMDFLDHIIVTLGPQGVLIARKTEKKQIRHYPVEKIENFINVSGAGDCFASGFIVGYLNNLPEENCVSVGFAAALQALYSKFTVPDKLFDKNHSAFQIKSKYTIIL